MRMLNNLNVTSRKQNIYILPPQSQNVGEDSQSETFRQRKSDDGELFRPTNFPSYSSKN